MKRSLKLAIAVTFTMLVAASSFAATVPSTNANNITAQVVEGCKWDTPFAISFGAYDPFAASAKTASVTMAFRCVKKSAATYKIWFDVTGGNMTNGTDNLAFTLTNGGAALKTSAASAATLSGSAGLTGGFSYTVDGSLAAGQDVSVGNYAATVVANVEY